MTKKRPGIMHAFLGKDAPVDTEQQLAVKTVRPQLDKMTFYLPQDLITRFHALYTNKLSADRKVKKTVLAAEIFDRGLRNYEGK